MSPFIIMYESQEGSSAIVQSLGHSNEVFIVGFEHLDHYSLCAQRLAADHRVGELLDDAFQLGRAPGWIALKQLRPRQAIGFKWRPFGGIESIKAIARNGCVVFHLVRRSSTRRALSILVSQAGFGKQHLQFDALAMPPELRGAFLKNVRAASVSLEAASIAEKMVSYTEVVARIWDNYGMQLKSEGLRVIPLFYEDFLVNPLAFLNNILLEVGVKRFVRLPPSQFQKVFPRDIERNVANWLEIGCDPLIHHAESLHDNLVQRMTEQGDSLKRQSVAWRAWAGLASTRLNVGC